MSKAAAPFADVLARAVAARRAVAALEADPAAHRLSPAAFVRHACAAAGITEAELATLAAPLDRSDMELAARAVRRMAQAFQPAQHAPYAPGWRSRIDDTELALLASVGLTAGRACALAAWQAVQGHDETSWRGRASRDGEAAEKVQALQAELATLVAELTTRWREIVQFDAPDHQGRVVLRGNDVDIHPIGSFGARLVEHAAAQPEATRKAA